MLDLSSALIEALDADLEEFRRRLRARVRRSVRTTLGESVGSPAFHVVELLMRHKNLAPSDLASMLQVRTSTMTAHLDRLEDLGWVIRTQSGPGRVSVGVTDKGALVFARYLEVRRAVLLDVMKPLSPEQVEALAKTLHACVEGQRQASARG